jgi:GcrA cell cycle regulator
MPFDWTEERIENLKGLFASGQTAAEIADRLGLSRGSVAGKLDRLGIVRGFIKKKKVKAPAGPNKLALGIGPQIQAINRGPHLVAAPLKVVHDADDVRPRHIGLSELTQNTCRWPYGDEAPFTFCGCQPIPRSPYCFHHDQRSKPPALQRAAKMGRVA